METNPDFRHGLLPLRGDELTESQLTVLLALGDRGDEGLHDPELGLRILIPLEGTVSITSPHMRERNEGVNPHVSIKHTV